MTRGRSRLAGLLFVLLGFLASHRQAPAAAADPSCGVEVVVQRSGATTYRLAHPFLRKGSDSVWTSAGKWARGSDYLIDALRGDIRLMRAAVPGETLWVAACWLLAPPPLEYARQRYQPARGGDVPGVPTDSSALPTPRPATGRDPGIAPGGASLAVSGNKTVAVEFGSTQDATLRQSLDLSVSGQLAPGVELTGVLSDRDTPLSATGSTQDLKALDRVLIELKAPRATASLGDLPLSYGHGEFARLERRVQGVRGEWRPGDGVFSGAAASAQGEYHRLQFAGVDGRQGPYVLTDREGATGVTVVAGSDVVTLDGQRLTRGEAADYFLDYERARITFSNRRPISSASRITVEYQYAVTRFRRNLATASGDWRSGGISLFAGLLTESDDRGRPLDVAFSAEDRRVLAAAGDSLARAVGPGVTPGVGDYDTVRVAADTLVFAFAGLDSGAFSVRFARVGEGQGDYLDSALVGGRSIYRWTGPGRGRFVVGRALALPESHQLATLGGAWRAGAALLELEGAVSRRDLNTFSADDDANNVGSAGRVALLVEGALHGVPGRLGASLGARTVEQRFSPFSRLERPFAEEDWGLARDADLEHQRRGEAAVFWRPAAGQELRGDWARLSTADGFLGTRRRAQWSGTGQVATQLSWLDSDGRTNRLRAGGSGRKRLVGDLRWTTGWLVPIVRFERDRRRTATDSTQLRDAADEWGGDLATGSRLSWRVASGFTSRRDQREAGLTRTRLASRVWRTQLESPVTGALGVSVAAQRRATRDQDTRARTLNDLASVRLRGEQRAMGLAGTFQVEITNEAENRRVRALRYVGVGLGTYDAFGNVVGTGDYELVLTVSPELERLARVATSARAEWRFGSSEGWRGSRVEFSLEDEARRRGDLRLSDVVLSTGAALADPSLARGSIAQRLETELAPGSRAAAVRLRAERRVNVDRLFEGFSQTTDLRTGLLRWRARPSNTVTLEAEARVQWQQASQRASVGGRFDRTLVEQGANAQLVLQPSTGLRAAAVADLSWSRPHGQLESTRTIRFGPDFGVNVGSKGRADLSVRRAFVSGAPAVALLPSADPAGAARWDGTARFDLRLHESTTFGLSSTVRERPGRATVVNGRVEVRAFF
ncbi:MAG: hypothetical protein ABIU54_10025 [Candidatus Eisenbacteria bacterium]